MCSAACLGFSARLPHRHLWARAAVKPYHGGCPVNEIKRPCGLKRPRTLNIVVLLVLLSRFKCRYTNYDTKYYHRIISSIMCEPAPGAGCTSAPVTSSKSPVSELCRLRLATRTKPAILGNRSATIRA